MNELFKVFIVYRWKTISSSMGTTMNEYCLSETWFVIIMHTCTAGNMPPVGQLIHRVKYEETESQVHYYFNL